jgi:hypothetical protein
VLFALAACGGKSSQPAARAFAPSAQASAEQVRAEVTADGHCVMVQVMEAGAEREQLCAADASARGLTIVDLTDTWTPAIFAPGPDGQVPSFHDRYLAFASEHDDRGRALQGEDALAELYGIVPALAIVRARLADDTRHACHAAIDATPIAKLDRTLSLDDKPFVDQQNAWRTTYAAILPKHPELQAK